MQVGFSSSCYTQVAGSFPAKFPEEVTKLQQAEESKDFSFSYSPRPRRALGSPARLWKEEKAEEVLWYSVRQISVPLPRGEEKVLSWGSWPPSSTAGRGSHAPGGMEGESLGIGSVWAHLLPAAPHRAGLSEDWGGGGASYSFAKQPLGVATPHLLLNRQLTHACHGCLVPEVPLLCRRWPTPALGLLVGSGLPTFGKLPEPLTSS